MEKVQNLFSWMKTDLSSLNLLSVLPCLSVYLAGLPIDSYNLCCYNYLSK